MALIHHPEIPDADGKEIEKRRPKPFRYVTPEELQRINEVTLDENVSFSVMRESTTPLHQKINCLFESPVGLGDIDKIETVIQRHEAKRKKQKTDEQP